MDGPGEREGGIVSGGVKVNRQDWRALSKGKKLPQVLLSPPCEGPLWLLAL